MQASAIRQLFLEYFERQQHSIRPSGSLVPGDDPTLLFANAGMVQFKKVFLGIQTPQFGNRATTSQKVVRAGGKHNDLENVGFTARHHTFFEMLGNFSFGDYFKKDAIRFAWELLTVDLKIPKEKLLITVHESDDEALNIWHKDIGVPEGHQEIDDEGRYVEIWNLVFMQYEKYKEGDEIKRKLLPKPSVDTGSGLERVAAALQGKYYNYDTDIFEPIMKSIGKLAGKD